MADGAPQLAGAPPIAGNTTKVGEKRSHGIMEATSNSKTLLFAAQQFELLYNTQTVGDLDSLTATNVRLHKDAIFTHNDILGQKNLKQYFQAFFKKYEYKHMAVCFAVAEPQNIVFSLAVDSDVHPKDGVFTKLDDKETTSSRCISIWMYTFDTDGRITDIRFLRQPSRDEMARKFVSPPDYSAFKFDPTQWAGPYLEPDAARTQKMLTAATSFAGIWATGDPSAVDSIMHPDVKDENVLFGGVKHGRQAFKDTIVATFKSWSPKTTHNDIAVTPSGNKAFIYWSAQGVQENTQQQNDIYGFNFLVFDTEGQITDILGFRQPLASERPKLLQADA